MPRGAAGVRGWTTHLAEVPDVKEVEGVKQLAVAQAELVVAHFQKGPDVLQTQELNKRRRREKKNVNLLESRNNQILHTFELR